MSYRKAYHPSREPKTDKAVSVVALRADSSSLFHFIPLDICRLVEELIHPKESEESPWPSAVVDGLDQELARACAAGDADLVQELLAAGANPLTSLGSASKQAGPRTPMGWAATRGCAHIVPLLPPAAVNFRPPVSQDAAQGTPLYWASRFNHPETVRALLDAGADFRLQRSIGSTPMHGAAAEGADDVIRLLVAAGADVNGRKNDLASVVFISAQYNHPRTVRLLHSLGADVLVGRDNGATPLLIAAQKGNLEVVQVLLELGAAKTIDAATTRGITALTTAIANGKTDVVRVLIKAGANVHTKAVLAAAKASSCANSAEIVAMVESAQAGTLA